MIVEISHFLAIISTALFFLAGLFALTIKNTFYTTNLISKTFSHAFLFFSASFFIYIYLAITDDFSVQYIANHSKSSLPAYVGTTSTIGLLAGFSVGNKMPSNLISLS